MWPVVMVDLARAVKGGNVIIMFPCEYLCLCHSGLSGLEIRGRAVEVGILGPFFVGDFLRRKKFLGISGFAPQFFLQ